LQFLVVNEIETYPHIGRAQRWLVLKTGCHKVARFIVFGFTSWDFAAPLCVV
jgi:hypothetical protein